MVNDEKKQRKKDKDKNDLVAYTTIEKTQVEMAEKNKNENLH